METTNALRSLLFMEKLVVLLFRTTFNRVIITITQKAKASLVRISLVDVPAVLSMDPILLK